MFIINFGNIVTVTVSSNVLPPKIQCSLIFLLNVCLEMAATFSEMHGTALVSST